MLIKFKHNNETEKASILVGGVELFNSINKEIKNTKNKDFFTKLYSDYLL